MNEHKLLSFTANIMNYLVSEVSRHDTVRLSTKTKMIEHIQEALRQVELTKVNYKEANNDEPINSKYNF